MKIEVSKHATLLAAAAVILLSCIVLTNAYLNPQGLTNNAAYVGHSVDEVDWSQTITKAIFTTACLGTDCRTVWPSLNTIMPTTCVNGGTIKYNTATKLWECGTDNTGTTMPICTITGQVPKWSTTTKTWTCGTDAGPASKTCAPNLVSGFDANGNPTCVADKVGTTLPASGNDCTAGNYVSGLTATGTVKCLPLPSGGGGGGTGAGLWTQQFTTNYALGQYSFIPTECLGGYLGTSVYSANTYYVVSGSPVVFEQSGTVYYGVEVLYSSPPTYTTTAATKVASLSGCSGSCPTKGEYCVAGGTWMQSSFQPYNCYYYTSAGAARCACTLSTTCKGCTVLKCV